MKLTTTALLLAACLAATACATEPAAGSADAQAGALFDATDAGLSTLDAADGATVDAQADTEADANKDAADAGGGSVDATTGDAAQLDVMAVDVASSDVASSDAGTPDAGPPTLPIACGFTLNWTAPAASTFHAVGDPVTLTGTLATATWPLTQLSVVWSSNGTTLATTAVAASGVATLATTALVQGATTLTAQVLTPAGPCKETSTLQIGLCSEKIAESFDTKPTGKIWKTFGDAFWDPGGWLEITGNEKSKQGAFYDVVHSVTPGDASIRFRIATGGGINGGADGYALNFVEAPTIGDLEAIIKAGGGGGCLGYGVAGKCGTMAIKAFHVEFDTWQNKADPNTDPTASNHIGILLNGNSSDHKLFVALSNLEDLKWHDVRVDIVGKTVKVFWDGAKKVEKAVSDLDFRGGRIFISGSTGWATNFHRLDDLVVLHGCQ